MGPGWALAFSAGVVAAVNPCGFAMLPAYLAYYLGLSDDGATGHGGKNPMVAALSVSAAVSSGVLAVFLAVGFAWSSVSSFVGPRLPYFTIVIGLGLAAVGVAMLWGYEPAVRVPHLRTASDRRGHVSMFLYGAAFAVASLGCTLPIFVGVVATTFLTASFADATTAFLAYGLGMSSVLAVLTVATAAARTGVLTALRRLLPHVQKISGGLLIAAGLFVTYYAVIQARELRSGDSSGIVEATRRFQTGFQNWVETVGAARLAIGTVITLTATVAVASLWRNAATSPEHQAHPDRPDEQ